MAIPVKTLAKLEACYRSVSEFCSTLTESQWKSPTQLPGWSVQDNLSHLASWEGQMSGRATTPHRTTHLENVRNPIGEDNEHEVDARRLFTGERVLNEWNEVVAERIALLRSADEAYFESISDGPTGPTPLREYLEIRVLDLWTHEQDMRRALGILGHQSGPAAEHTIDRLIRSVPTVVGKRAQTPEGKTVVFHITGGVQRSFAITVIEGRAKNIESIPADVLCTISMQSDEFLQLATGRASHQELQTEIMINGDSELGHRIVSQFTMMI